MRFYRFPHIYTKRYVVLFSILSGNYFIPNHKCFTVFPLYFSVFKMYDQNWPLEGGRGYFPEFVPSQFKKKKHNMLISHNSVNLFHEWSNNAYNGPLSKKNKFLLKCNFPSSDSWTVGGLGQAA